jgi:hypothetical protein
LEKLKGENITTERLVENAGGKGNTSNAHILEQYGKQRHLEKPQAYEKTYY